MKSLDNWRIRFFFFFEKQLAYTINLLKRRQISIHVDMVAKLQEASWEDTDSTKKKHMERMDFHVDEKNEKKRKLSEMYSFHNFQLNIYLFHA